MCSYPPTVIALLTRSYVWQHDVNVEHFEIALAIQGNLDVISINFGVFGNDLNQFLVQCWKKVRAVASVALARNDDLKSLLGCTRALRFVIEQE